MGILCKMNTDQNYMEFFCKFFCWYYKGNPLKNPQKRPVRARDFEPKIPKFRHKNLFFWYLKIVTSQFSKIKKNNFSSTLSVPSFKKIGEPRKRKKKKNIRNCQDALFASASFCEYIKELWRAELARRRTTI